MAEGRAGSDRRTCRGEEGPPRDPAGVDSVYPLSLSHTFFMCQLGMVLQCLLPRVAHKKHALRVRML